MKVKAGKKKAYQKKKKKSSSILILENKETDNYHEKKNENNIENDEPLNEETYKVKLKEIYNLIKEEKYEKKPTDIFINNANIELI